MDRLALASTASRYSTTTPYGDGGMQSARYGGGSMRGRSASPSTTTGMVLSTTTGSPRRSVRMLSPKHMTATHTGMRATSPMGMMMVGGGARVGSTAGGTVGGPASPTTAAARATTLYLQRHLQRMQDHNAVGGRPLTLHHHDDSGKGTQQHQNDDSSVDATYRRRLQILRENQNAARANLNKPAGTSTSQGGIGGVWSVPAGTLGGTTIATPSANTITANPIGMMGTITATSIPRTSFQSPLHRRRHVVRMTSKL